MEKQNWETLHTFEFQNPKLLNSVKKLFLLAKKLTPEKKSAKSEKVRCDKQIKIDTTTLENRGKNFFYCYFLLYQILCQNQRIYIIVGRNCEYIYLYTSKYLNL